MANNTVTLGVNGELPLDDFVEAVHRFRRLVKALTREIAGKADVRWKLDDLRFGSADISLRGEALDTNVVPGITRAYAVVGQSLASGKPIPYSSSVAKEARALVALVGDDVTSIEFRTDDEDAEIFAPDAPPDAGLVGAFGAVSGQVETLSMRRGYRFILYDDLFDHAVSCHLGVGQAERMRDAWGHAVIVEGWVERHSITGIPARISQITGIEAIQEPAHGNFRRARGASPYRGGDSLPEDRIRLVRDA